MFKCLRRLVLVALLAWPATASAQTPAAESAPAAAPADVATPDAIIAALYDVISGGAGVSRDWDRMRSLFIPGARLIPTAVTAQGVVRHRVMTVEEFIATNGPYFERNGFFETETHRVTERYGNVLHAFSTYDSRHTAEDAEPFARGINSIQLLHDGTRWWVVTVFWDAERPGNPIPAEYLP